MNISDIREIIESNFDKGFSQEFKNDAKLVYAIDKVMSMLDSGSLKICEKSEGSYVVNEWIKKAILLSFKIWDNKIITSGQVFGYNQLNDTSPYFGSDNKDDSNKSQSFWYDKIPSKFSGWDEEKFKNSGIRAVPGSFARYGSHISKGVVLMPSFVNIGAFIDEGTMIDTWATVGSCAQIGKNCHISGGAGIGGVLEPLQANPVIIEDGCFIGARSEIVEGVIVGKGSVISMGVYIGKSTKIIDRETGEVIYGKIPEYSVVVPGSVMDPSGNIGLYAAIIIKKVDEKTRSKTAINEILREYNK